MHNGIHRTNREFGWSLLAVVLLALLFAVMGRAETVQMVDKGLTVEQCRLMPDIAVFQRPQGTVCTPHVVMTNVADSWSDVVVRFYDARHGGFVELAYRIPPERKAKINLQEGDDHAAIMWGNGNRPENEEWFVDGYMVFRSNGGDVRVMLEQQRGGVPVREYGQDCR